LALEKTGFAAHHVRFVGLLAESLLELGDAADASGLLSNAMSVTREHGNDWYLAELLRIKAIKLAGKEILRRLMRSSQAISLAKQQGAGLWVMRATAAFATLAQQTFLPRPRSARKLARSGGEDRIQMAHGTRGRAYRQGSFCFGDSGTLRK